MTLQLQSLSLGASHHLQAWCALVAPHQAPRFELPHANYNRTNPAFAPVSFTIYSASLSPYNHTIQFA